MKTIDKIEAVRAFADGKRVECRRVESVKWHTVEEYGAFDFDRASFRLAAVDDDAAWLRMDAARIAIGGYNTVIADRQRAIAARLEADKARIAELEEKSSAIESEHLAMCGRLQDTVQKFKLGLGGEKIDALVCDRLAELEAEIAKLQDTVAVHRSMLRGTIAWTVDGLKHLLGDIAQEPKDHSAKGGAK